jgi:hypothetical protein
VLPLIIDTNPTDLGVDNQGEPVSDLRRRCPPLEFGSRIVQWMSQKVH